MAKSYLDKIAPFFKKGVDLSQINNPNDILELPFNQLKVMEDHWTPFFEDLGISTIKELAQYTEPMVFEGLDPDETSKLAMICETIFWYLTQLSEVGETKKKITFLGLGNAGKTSAITALSEKYSSIKELLPTRGLSRRNTEIFGFDVMAFDFGGQSEYRQQYFEKGEMFFTASDIVLFFLDIQDSDRYDESLDYFKNILEAYEKLNSKPPILIVFSKMDPDVANDEILNKGRIELIEKFETIADGYDIGYANSSIFERNSIENLFSLALKKISTTGGVIQELLRTYVADINARAAVLISSSGLVFGTYGKTHSEEEMLKNSASYLQNLYLFHLTTGIQPEEFYELNYKRNNLHFIAEQITEIASGSVYLWILTTDLRKEVLGIPKFREDLMPLIELFL